jgi:hypothetical protein
MKQMLALLVVLVFAAWEIVRVRRRMANQVSAGTITLEFAKKRSAYLWNLWFGLTIIMALGVIIELTR